jgi:hypothetical protein
MIGSHANASAVAAALVQGDGKVVSQPLGPAAAEGADHLRNP